MKLAVRGVGGCQPSRRLLGAVRHHSWESAFGNEPGTNIGGELVKIADDRKYEMTSGQRKLEMLYIGKKKKKPAARRTINRKRRS